MDDSNSNTRRHAHLKRPGVVVESSDSDDDIYAPSCANYQHKTSWKKGEKIQHTTKDTEDSHSDSDINMIEKPEEDAEAELGESI
jgi:hypothetical protein